MTIKLTEIELTMISDALDIALKLRWADSWIAGTARALVEKLDQMALEIEKSGVDALKDDAAILTTINKEGNDNDGQSHG